MKNTYYLLEVEGGIEPIVRGHYQTNRDRDNAAKQIRRRQDEDDGLFWADVDKAGTLTVGAYVEVSSGQNQQNGVTWNEVLIEVLGTNSNGGTSHFP